MSALLQTPDGYLWFGTEEGLVRFDGGAFTVFDKTNVKGLRDNAISALCLDSSAYIWVGTWSGDLLRVKDGVFEDMSGGQAPLRGGVWSIVEGSEGDHWAATSLGLLRIRGGARTLFTTAEGLPTNDLRTLCRDGSGGLWIGTRGAGLFRMRAGRFETPPETAPLKDYGVWCLLAGRDGALWIGTTAGGLSRLKDGRLTRVWEDANLQKQGIRALCEDKDGNLWVGTEAGELDRYSAGRWSHLGAAEGLGGDFVVSILERRDGSLWAGTYGGGLAHIEGGRFTTKTTRDGLPNNEVWCLHEDRGGRLWIGTTGGLAVLDGGVMRTYVAADGLSSEVIVSAFESPTGSLWFGTSGGGVVRFKDGTLKACTRKEGLHDDVVFQILPDGLGNLWMSCNKGLFRVPLQMLEDFADGKRSTVTCAAYGKSDGMGSSECMGGSQPAGCVTRDGRLWFPTAGGLVCVDPARLPFNTVPPPLAIEALLADDRPVMEKVGAVVPAGTHGLEVRYAALSLRAPERVRFKYRLVGFDGGWIEAGSRRTAYYTNVPPGRYTFEMTACNEDGVWNKTGTSIPVRVLPRFYQTVPFFVTCLALAAGTAWGGYRLRVRHLRVRERKLVALVKDRTAQLSEANAALEERTRQVSEANRALEERGRELEEANRQLTELSHRDPLTGLANRRHFETVLDSEWRRASRTGSPLSLLMADVDSFKAYNDTYGHPGGDACLKRVAYALQSGLRRAGDLLARYGGEEFVVILPDMPLDQAAAMAEELRLRLRAMQIPHAAAFAAPVVTVSFGVAVCHPKEGGSPADLVAASDRALYRAKKAGRNRVDAG